MAFTFYGAVKEASIYKISKKIRLIECFAGVGTQAMALRNLRANFERYRAYDFDKDAVKSYNAIHETNFEPTDIRDVKGEDLGIADKDKYEYLLTYSFPCTDLSCSGVQAGMKKGSGTRSGLLWEVERLLTETKELPQVLVMENVIQVHNPKNMPDFQLWLNFLESKGYKNFYADLNAKDFNLAQNRVRCFMVSVLGDYVYKFPKGVGLTKTLDDYLEDEVDASYYLEQSRQDAMIRDLKDRIGTTIVEDFYQTVRGNRYYQETAPTLRAERHGLKVICASRGRIIENKELRVNESSTWTQQLEPNKCGTTNTLTTVAKDNLLLTGSNGDYTVRSLTPKECWRFMGYSDEDYEKAASVCAPTKLYKQAGNAIALPVMEAVFKELL